MNFFLFLDSIQKFLFIFLFYVIGGLFSTILPAMVTEAFFIKGNSRER